MENKEIKKQCFICGGDFVYYMTGEDFDRQTTQKKFDIYKCSSCGVEKIFPELSLQEIMSFYPQNYYSFNIKNTNQKGFMKFFERILYNIYRNKNKTIKPILKRWKMGIPYKIQGNGYFLDIGCGDGYILELMQKLGWKTYGFEIGEKKEVGNIMYRFNIKEADFGGIQFDFIRVAHVMEHISNPIEFIQKIKEILAPQGIAEFTLPNTKSFDAKVFGKYRSNRDIPRHLINYNIDNLEIFFRKQGFLVVKKRYILGFGLIGSLKHLLKYKYKINTKLLDFKIIKYIGLSIDFILSLLGMGDHIGFTIKK